MANVDPRLGSLIDTLISSGADWLALEILSEIRMGHPEEHSQEELEEAREAIGKFRKKDSAPPRLEMRQVAVHHLTGEEQIEFAANYAIERITQNIEMVNASLRQLNEVADRSASSFEAGIAPPRRPAAIELAWTETEGRVARPQIEDVRTKLPALRTALLEWSKAAREGESNG